MAFVTYRASESLIPFHVATVQYSIDFSVQSADKQSEILKREQRSLSGVKETLYYGKKVTWSIKTGPIVASECGLFEEFLDSTADGQVFTFDPHGSSQNPRASMQCDREDSGWQRRRMTITGDPQYSDHFEYMFTVSQRS